MKGKFSSSILDFVIFFSTSRDLVVQCISVERVNANFVEPVINNRIIIIVTS
jgi:hypothetical protein